ncbi:MerR family transcriptional regulator [Paenibacillus sp. HB172176]|uniref:MerR family transcriptional regulator n=1 Tax=Paenibacillus sp. HB172176 TaxID=2493690 RepID=UPI00143887AC|nr:MerR family transcriptional regulator [Paenibacillus sp. HB172176]
MKTQHTFTIKQTARQTGVSEDTLRYYEKIAIMPRIDRNGNGHRVYRQEDIDRIRLISCLKKTGLPLEEMRPFLGITADTDPAEYPELMEQLRSHRENIQSQIRSLQQVVDFIDMKLEETTFRKDCSVEHQAGGASRMGGRKREPASFKERSYFPVLNKGRESSHKGTAVSEENSG